MRSHKSPYCLQNIKACGLRLMCDMDRKGPCFSSYHKDKYAHTSNYQPGTFASAAIALEKLKLWDQLVSQTFHDVFNTNKHLLLHEK
jgi:hypothetical protein